MKLNLVKVDFQNFKFRTFTILWENTRKFFKRQRTKSKFKFPLVVQGFYLRGLWLGYPI